MWRICLWYSECSMTAERKAEGGIFITWWTAELVKGPPLMQPALLRLFQSIPSTMQHAGTCSLLGDHRWSERGPEPPAVGIFSPALHFAGMGRLGFAGCSIKERGRTSETDTSEETLLFFYLLQSAVCKHQWHAVCHLAYIFMTSCGAFVKSFPLSRKKKWGRSITLQCRCATCSSWPHSSQLCQTSLSGTTREG